MYITSVPCNYSSSPVCHGAIVTGAIANDSITMYIDMVRQLNACLSHYNLYKLDYSVCPSRRHGYIYLETGYHIAIVPVRYRYATLCNDSNCGAQVNDGNSGIFHVYYQNKHFENMVRVLWLFNITLVSGYIKTHLPIVTVSHTCVSESGQHWFR